MELRQLRSFCSVVRSGSFTKAAEEQGITQPSLSQQIHRLEESVGTKLFSRVGRSARLTPAGKLLHAYAIPIVARATRALAHLHRIGSDPDTTLRIGSVPTILPYLLAPKLADFKRLHPEIEIKLEEDLTASLIPRLQACELDLIVIALPLRETGIITKEIMRDPLVIVAPQHDQMDQNIPSHEVNIAQERLLLLKEGHCLRNNVLDVCRLLKMEVHPEFESNDLASLFALVQSGAGVAVAPMMSLGSAMGCRAVPLPRPHFRRIGYAHLSNPIRKQALGPVIEWLIWSAVERTS